MVLTPNTPGPELQVVLSEDAQELRVVITAPPSVAVMYIQRFTMADATPDVPNGHYDGLLAGLVWRKPYLDGQSYTFTAEAVHKETRVKYYLTIKGGVSIGWPGGGPDDTLAMLRQLNIANDILLNTLIRAPRHGVASREAWRETLVPSDFGEQYNDDKD